MNPNMSNLTRSELEAFARKSGRALRHLHDEEYEEAIKAYEELDRLMPFPVNLLMLSRSYIAVGRIEDAIAVLERAVDLSGGNQDFSAELAGVKRDSRELFIRFVVSKLLKDPSKNLCREIIRRNPSLVDKTLLFILREDLLAYAQKRKADIMNSLYIFAEAVAEQWNDELTRAIVLNLRGVKELTEAKLLEAIGDLRAAVELFRRTDGKDMLAFCLNHYGMAAEQMGEFEEAVQAYSESIDHFTSAGKNEACALVLENLGGLYMKHGNYTHCMEIGKRVEQLYQEQGKGMALKARLLQANCLAYMGVLDQALDILDQVIEHGLWSDSPILLGDAMFSKSYVLEDMERLDEAQAIRINAVEIYKMAGVDHLPYRKLGISAQLNDFDHARREQLERIRAYEKAGMVLEAAREKMNLASLSKQHIAAIVLPGYDPNEEQLMSCLNQIYEADELLDECTETFSRLNASHLLLRAQQGKIHLLAAWGTITNDITKINQALQMIDSTINDAKEIS